ncbi:MAG: FAD-dependent oxidoreductase [Clostridia bacterium]|nr:FAD-dependent oxidoreductase [Clostridia bacterium]
MDKKTVKFTPLVIDEDFDVVVVGGGLAGVMASISAARDGSKVILIEKHGCLGGMATAGLVYPFMRDREYVSENPVNAGLYLAMQEEIYAIGGSEAPHSRHYKEEFMKIALDRMVRRYGIKVLFHAKLTDVDITDGKVMSVKVATVSGNISVKGKVFIDATGNADLCAFAGLPYQLGREQDSLCQPMTLCFRLGNVDWSRYNRAEANKLYALWKEQGKIQNPREDILVFKYPVGNIMHMNTTRVVGLDPTNVEDVTSAEIMLREQMLEMYNFMRENISGLENCELLSSAAEAGIRESRRIVGLTQITADDILNVTKFQDSIARGAYEIDIHSPDGAGTFHARIPDNEYYTIPYRSMIPEHSENIIAAGRSISTTHEALASVRIMPITSCMGEAAGIAASMAVKTGKACRDIDTDALRGEITAYGGLV